jgi:hypothetical protein
MSPLAHIAAPQLGADVRGGDEYPAPLLGEPTVRRYFSRIQHAQAGRLGRERESYHMVG